MATEVRRMAEDYAFKMPPDMWRNVLISGMLSFGVGLALVGPATALSAMALSQTTALVQAVAHPLFKEHYSPERCWTNVALQIAETTLSLVTAMRICLCFDMSMLMFKLGQNILHNSFIQTVWNVGIRPEIPKEYDCSAPFLTI